MNYFFRNKLILILAVLISISCADSFYDELYSAFYPEVSKRPSKSERFFFTNFYPYGKQIYQYDPNEDHDSINIASWVKYTGNKIPQKIIYDGLYHNVRQFQTVLKKKGYADAAKYVSELIETEKLIISKYGDSYWEEPLPKDTSIIISLYPKLEQNIKSCTDLFLKERYIYLLIKTSMSVNDHKSTINFYENYGEIFQQRTFISDWSRCKYAGALYHNGDHARSFYEFGQLFQQSPTVRAEAGNSVIVYNIPFSEQAVKFCKNDAEKANVYALAAILPKGNGLGMMKKVYSLDPNHSMLELIASREINKNEELYFNVKMSSEDEFSPGLNSLKNSSISDLLSFINLIIAEDKADNPGFWKLAGSYLYFMSGEPEKGKNYLAEIYDDPSNPYIIKQKRLLGIFFELQSNTIYDENSFVKIYNDIKSLMTFRDARDMSSMKLISRLLTDYFNHKSLKADQPGSKSFFSGCGKKNMKVQSVDSFDQSRVFFAQSLSNLSGTYEENGVSYFLGGFERQLFLDTLSTDLLKIVVTFIEQQSIIPIDSMLISISGFSNNEIYLAYGRRLMIDHRFEDALIVYKKIDKEYFHHITDPVEFRSGPKLFLKHNTYEPITDHLAYLSDIVRHKKAAEINEKDAESWFKLGEALVNISYYGKAWILSKSMRSSGEMEYYWWLSESSNVKPNEKDNNNYYGNEAALVCFEKAAKHCKDKNLCARISYLGAVAEKSRFWHQYFKNQPKDYEKQDSYHLGQMIAFNAQFRTFFQLLKDKFYDSDYEKMILNECDEYRQFTENQ